MASHLPLLLPPSPPKQWQAIGRPWPAPHLVNVDSCDGSRMTLQREETAGIFQTIYLNVEEADPSSSGHTSLACSLLKGSGLVPQGKATAPPSFSSTMAGFPEQQGPWAYVTLATGDRPPVRLASRLQAPIQVHGALQKSTKDRSQPPRGSKPKETNNRRKGVEG